MNIWAKVAFLKDSAEDVFYTAERVLKPLGITQFTPLGVLYLLTQHPEAKHRVGVLMNRDPLELAEAAREELVRRYGQGKDSQQFSASPSLEAFLDRITQKEAGGGVNVAEVDHIVLALVSMQQREGNDARVVLQSLGIKESEVRKVRTETPLKTEDLTSDFAAAVMQSDEPQAELESRKKAALQLLAALTKQKGANVLLYGPEGSGRHGILRQMTKDIVVGLFPFAKDWKVRMLQASSLRASSSLLEMEKAMEKVGKIVKGLPQKAILIIDEVKAEDLRLFKPLLEHQTPAVLVSTASEARLLEGQEVGLLERFAVPEVSPQEVRAMLEVYCASLSAFHGVDISLTAAAYEALIRYGALVTGLALPGAAVRLLDLVAAHAKLLGDNKVDLDDVARVIADRTGVSLQALTQSEREKLLNLDEIFDRNIVGQEPAKTVIREALYSAYVGLKEKGRPIGSFVFLGPTGVGKTEMARALAQFLFSDEEAMIRIDMSEYQESHTVARLIGSPPGYVGYDQGGQLTEAIQKKPFSVILFDEIDKANPVVMDVLLQVLDAGRLTDGKGRTIDFSHTILIFTSNHGSSLFYQAIEEHQDFAQVKQEALEWFRTAVRPELFNRFDAVVVFDALSREDQAKILEILLTKFVERPMKDRYGVTVLVDESAKALLLEKGFDAALGARPLKRIINQEVRNPLAAKLLKEELSQGSTIWCTAQGTQILFESTTMRSKEDAE